MRPGSRGAWPVGLSLLLAASVGCATVDSRHQHYVAMSAPSQAQYDKYQQFMTEDMKDHYLALASDDDRSQLIASMHVEDRLARYPAYIQEAIWSRQPVIGMDKRALFFCLGTPDSVDRDEVDPDTHLLPTEHWFYRRGPQRDESYDITIINGEISAIKEPKIR